MVFRRSLQNVRSRDDYFSGAAQPAAFEGFQINPARMVSLANSIKADDIPPRVRIQVTEEDLGTEGRDFFGEGLSEQLFDTPSAIARVWRVGALDAGRCRSRPARPPTRTGAKLTLRVAPAAGRPRAGEDRARRGRRGARGSPSTGTSPSAISDDNPVRSSRVDIGVFANNGVHDSAPAILSWYFPPEEARSYAPGPGRDAAHRRDRLCRPPAGLRRPDADPARRLARRLPLRPGRHAHRLDPHPRRPERRVRRGRRAHPRPRRRRCARRVEAVAYPLARLPDGGLGIEEISAPR